MPTKLSDILKSRDSDQPPEIKAIKDYVTAKFKSDVMVAVKPNQITIITASAALAGSLRMHLPQLERAVKTNKKLVIRIG